MSSSKTSVPYSKGPLDRRGRHTSDLTTAMCIAKFCIICYKSPVLRILILDPTLCRISYHFLQEPRTPHNAVKSDALPSRNSMGCTERIFWSDCSTCGCDDELTALGCLLSSKKILIINTQDTNIW